MFRCASDNPEILSLQVYSTLETSQCVSISFSLIKFQNITRRFRIHNKTKKKKKTFFVQIDFFFKTHKYLNNFSTLYGLWRATRLRIFQRSGKTQASISSKCLFPFVQQNPHTIGTADHTMMFS